MFRVLLLTTAISLATCVAQETEDTYNVGLEKSQDNVDSHILQAEKFVPVYSQELGLGEYSELRSIAATEVLTGQAIEDIDIVEPEKSQNNVDSHTLQSEKIVPIYSQELGLGEYSELRPVVAIEINSIDKTIVREAMEKNGVVPDVIDTAPAETLQVTFGKQKVNLGNELTPTQVKNIPTVQWNAEDGAYYLLCMTDPDAPSRKDPKFREWHHWLVGNIPGDKVNQGETLTEYVGSAPPKGSGLHRYVLLVYKQPGKLTFTEPHLSNRSGDNRAKFSIRNFVAKYSLGNPIAGNFYQAQYDDYVPKVYAQLKSN